MISVPSGTVGSREFLSLYLRPFRFWGALVGLVLADFVSFALAFAIFRWHSNAPAVLIFQNQHVPYNTHPIDVLLLLAPCFIIVRFLCGDYGRRQLFWEGARATTIAVLVTALPDLLFYCFRPLRYSLEAELSWPFLLIAIPFVRQIARMVMTKVGVWQLSTAVIAEGPNARRAIKALSQSLSLGYDIQLIIVSDQSCDVELPTSSARQLHLSSAEDIAARIAAAGCCQVIAATEDMRSPAFANLLQRLMEADVSVAFIPVLSRLPMVGVTTSYFFGHDMLLFQVSNNLRRLRHRFIKRAFDIVGSLALLALFSPVILLIALAIKLHDGGPITYAQKRVGRNRAPFRCYKFRTMVVDADERLARWRRERPEIYAEFMKTYKLRDDPRITAPGRWLRRTSLDELPQLINVLFGEMSLVGPRPIPDQQLRDQYGPAAEIYVRVRPGLTGLWQVSGRSETTSDERVVYDEWYILNWTFWYDVVILIQTAWIVATGRGAF